MPLLSNYLLEVKKKKKDFHIFIAQYFLSEVKLWFGSIFDNLLMYKLLLNKNPYCHLSIKVHSGTGMSQI